MKNINNNFKKSILVMKNKFEILNKFLFLK